MFLPTHRPVRAMDALRTFALALLVVLAGCSGILPGGGGGGSGTTVTPTAPPDPGPADGGGGPTPTPGGSTPTAAPTATPSPTPLPPGVETATVTNESLGISMTLTGNASVLSSADLGNVTGSRITQGGILRCARASPFVGASTNGSVADATVTMSYDPGMLPPNASESDLAVFAYNDTVEFYLEMEGSVDAANDTVVGTEVNASRNTFTREIADETQVIRPVVDGTRINYVFVVMHKPTYWEGVETRQVPDRCTADSGGGSVTPGGSAATDTGGSNATG